MRDARWSRPNVISIERHLILLACLMLTHLKYHIIIGLPAYVSCSLYWEKMQLLACGQFAVVPSQPRLKRMCRITFSSLALESYTERKVNNTRADCSGLTSSKSVLAQKLWRKSGNPFRRERKSGSEDNKLWQRGAELHLDCSGTGTRQRADAIAVFSVLQSSTARATGRDEGEKCVGDDLSTALPHTLAVE